MSFLGKCYKNCKLVQCRGNTYGNNCRIPIGDVDCLEVKDYTLTSCGDGNAVQPEGGFLHVRSNCHASFKLCTVEDFLPNLFPSVPNKLTPTHNHQPHPSPITVTQTNGHGNGVIMPTNHPPIITEKNTNNKLDSNNAVPGNNLHSDLKIDMTDSEVMTVDLGIGIGIGVVLAILAIIALLLCRRYHLKKKKNRNAKSSPTPLPTTSQTGNPLYDVNTTNSTCRISSISGRYDEIMSTSGQQQLSRTTSEPKYDSISSDTLNNSTWNIPMSSRIISGQSILYQSVGENVKSKARLAESGSDALYDSYFRRSNISDSTSASTRYFILDPNECRQDEAENSSEQISEQCDNMYFVLEKSDKDKT